MTVYKFYLVTEEDEEHFALLEGSAGLINFEYLKVLAAEKGEDIIIKRYDHVYDKGKQVGIIGPGYGLGSYE